MNILFLIDSLEYGGQARQLGLLARYLPRDCFTLGVCTLRTGGSWGGALRREGIEVECLNWSRPFDLRPWLALRRLVRSFRPAVIHAWGLTAFRAVAAAIPGGFPVLLSGLAQGGPIVRPGLLDQGLLRLRNPWVLAAGPTEANQCCRLGVASSRLVEVPPGVAPTGSGPESRAALCRSLGLAEGVRFLLCVGPLERAKGFRDAIWAFDILQFVCDDVHLLLIGVGPDEKWLRDFQRITQTTEQVHFLGPQTDVAPWFELADVVWVPSRGNRGVNTALEAMAAGRPVIATRWPALAEVVTERETGVLVAPGEPGSLARETRLLLDSPQRRQQMGEAGRRRAAECFSIEELVQRHSSVYKQVAGGG